jgi:hypothetical protein
MYFLRAYDKKRLRLEPGKAVGICAGLVRETGFGARSGRLEKSVYNGLRVFYTDFTLAIFVLHMGMVDCRWNENGLFLKGV